MFFKPNQLQKLLYTSINVYRLIEEHLPLVRNY